MPNLLPLSLKTLTAFPTVSALSFYGDEICIGEKCALPEIPFNGMGCTHIQWYRQQVILVGYGVDLCGISD